MEEGLPEGEQPLLESRVEREDGIGQAQSGHPTVPSGTTLLQTCFNILNVFVGAGLLSMPYALHKGGWLALAVQASLLPLFALSGQLIVWAFDLLPAGTPLTYPELGRAAGGRTGVQAVMFFSSLELFGGSCILLMVAWRMAELLLPAAGLGPINSMQLSAAAVSCLLLPILFVDIRKGLSRLSAVGLASSGMVLLMVVSLLVLDPRREAIPQQPPPGHHLLSVNVIQSAGIFALSATAHSTLPALRTAMRQPSQFPVALGAAFAAMLAAYTTLAAAGYWYFGDSASPLVTTDLATASYYSGGRVPVDRILAVLVLINCLTKYPGLNLVLQDMILSVLPFNRDDTGAFHPPRPWAAHSLRLILFAAGCLLGLTAYAVLGSALSLLGGMGSISCSLLLPTAFYASLAWRRLPPAPRAGLAALLVFGVGLVVMITATNVCELLPNCHHIGGSGAGLGNSLLAPLLL